MFHSIPLLSDNMPNILSLCVCLRCVFYMGICSFLMSLTCALKKNVAFFSWQMQYSTDFHQVLLTRIQLYLMLMKVKMETIACFSLCITSTLGAETLVHGGSKHRSPWFASFIIEPLLQNLGQGGQGPSLFSSTKQLPDWELGREGECFLLFHSGVEPTSH